jgi:hypothetical protein
MLGLGACLSAIALTACAGTVPWPPSQGSCVDAYKAPGRRRPWHYWIGGEPAKRSEVERTVYDTPARQAEARRARIVDTVSPFLIFGGAISMVPAVPVAGATGKPAFGLLALPGLTAVLTGLVLGAVHEDPFRPAVVRFNKEAERSGRCVDGPQPRPPPAPSRDEPAPPSREFLPVLPSSGWKP